MTILDKLTIFLFTCDVLLILSQNPTIKPEELEHRLRAFMGMQNRAQNAVVPGFAMVSTPTYCLLEAHVRLISSTPV